MLNKFFRFPFAATGDKTAVPDDIQPSGDVSYEQGYGFDYQRDPTSDPLAKNIERDKMNQLLSDITTALREYQIMGTPDFITSAQNGGVAFSYSKWAQVRYDGGSGFKIYQSNIDNNVSLPTVTPDWSEVGAFDVATYTASQAEAVAGVINDKFMTPLRVAQAVPAATDTAAGRIEIATSEEAQAFTDNSRAITPLGLKYSMLGANRSFSENGYQKLPSGLVIQWGRASVTANVDTNISLPITFPSAILFAVGSNATATTQTTRVDKVNSSTIVVFRSSTNGSVNWIAIGY